MPDTSPFAALPHQGFVVSRLPTWLTQAAPTARERLQALALAANRARFDLKAHLATLPTIEAFALARLQPLLKRLLEVEVDPCKAVLYWVDPEGKGAPIQRTLLHAALQNFHQQETQASAYGKGSGLFAGVTKDGKPDQARPLALRPEAFAKACRGLDLGERLREVMVEQVPASVPTKGAVVTETPSFAWLVYKSERTAFMADACAAWLAGRLGDEGQALLAHWQMAPETVAPTKAQAQRLTLLGFPHARVIVFSKQAPDPSGSAVVAYLPGDPEGSVVEHENMRALAISLGERVRTPGFLTFLSGFVPLAQRTAFIKQVQAAIAPGGWLPPHLTWSPIALMGDPFVEGYQVWAQQALAEAASIAVPTAAVDHQDSFERYAHWVEVGEQLGLNLILMVGSAIPGVNVIADAVMLAQSLYGLYEGIEAWERNDSQNALEHVFAAVENAAFFGLGKRPSTTAVDFAAGLVPVTGDDGQVRLWRPALEDFRAHDVPTDSVLPDAQGVYQHDGRAWLRLNGDLHEVDNAGTHSARLLPPRRQGYTPTLVGDGQGSWRTAHEHPANWNSVTLMRRFNERYRAIPEQALLEAQRLAGISDERLQKAHLDGTGMPATLAYLLNRQLAGAQVDVAVTNLRNYRRIPALTAPLVDTLRSIPGWPVDLAIDYVNGQVTETLGPTKTTERVRLDQANVADGTWAAALIAELDTPSRDAILGTDTSLVPAGTAHQVLADAWADALAKRKSALVQYLTDPPAVLDPARATLRRQFPGLALETLNALMHGATQAERRALIAGRMPPEIGEQAAEALRHVRVARALEALAQGEPSADRDRLALGVFAALGEWTEGVRVELRDKHVGGTLVQTAGKATAPRWVIVRQEGRYQAFDDQGLELGPQSSLEQALFATLPDTVRAAAAANKVTNAASLRVALLAQALGQRAQVRTFLGMVADNRRFFRPPNRQPNGALGYELSGRGGPSRGIPGPFDPYRVALSGLYPDVSETELLELYASLGEGEEATTALARLNADLARLRLELNQWVNQAAVEPAHDAAEDTAAYRRTFANQLIELWQRRESTLGYGGHGYGLRARNLPIGELPPLTVRFEHVRRLALLDMDLSRVSEAFLANFPNLLWLDVSMNNLAELPSVEGLPRLERLSLDYTGNRQASAILTAAAPRAQTLSHLDLAGLSLSLGPADFQALAQFSVLRTLDLEGNAITLTEETAAGFTRLPLLQDLSLGNNPLGLPPVVTQLSDLTVLDLRDAELQDFPPGLADLMDLNPTRLREVNLSDNLIEQLPDISNTRFVQLSREHYDDVESPYYGMCLNLNGNPLSDQTRDMLRQAGVSFYVRQRLSSGSELSEAEVNQDQWLEGCPDALAAAIREERTGHEAAEFYQLLGRVVDTADYQAQPLQTRQRVWALVETWLIPGEQALPGLQALRDRLFRMAQDTMGTCGDGVSLTLDEMEFEVQCWRTVANSHAPGDGPLLELLEYQRRLWRRALVDDIARRMVRAREARERALRGENAAGAPGLDPVDDLDDASLEDGIDEVEVRFFLFQQLEAALGLPPTRGMRYSTWVSRGTVSRVSAEVLARDTADAFAAWVAERPSFREYLENGRAQTFAPERERWQAAANYLYVISTEGTDSAPQWPEALDGLRAELPEVNWPDSAGHPPTLNEQQLRLAYDWVSRQQQQALDALALGLTRALLGLEIP
jgi:Leucine-rich repeat (LRR) protein